MSDALTKLLISGTFETLYMVLLAGFITLLIGLPIGVVLFITRAQSLRENALINRSLGLIVNVTRSVPFIILIIALIPLTRLFVGSSIGSTAAIVPLTIGAIPFFARIVESAISEVNPGLIEAGQSMGATTQQIIFRIMLPEALPAIINGFTLMLIALVGYSAMAGTVGGGGLGAIAINYGY
ncbi:MAG: ABC transporter permease, partial [Coxiellaceae bacterium]|nr:ABC transporter permease [Coxiellaceae bacterium]